MDRDPDPGPDGALAELPVPLLRLDAAGRCTAASAGFCALAGRTVSQLLGSAWTAAIDPADRDRVVAAVAGAADRTLDVRFRLCRPDGGSCAVLLQGPPRAHGDGARAGHLATCVDLGELERSQQEMLDVERRLQLAQRLESLAHLAGGVAHDFNNVLTGILGHCELARLRLPEGAPEGELLRTVLQAGRRAAELCKRMLAYAGRGALQPQWFDLSTVVADHRTTLTMCAPSGVRLDFALAEGLPPVHGDPAQFAQVVQNLVLNAAEAVASVGGGTVRVRTGSRCLDAGARGAFRVDCARRDGTFAVLEVADDGPGFAAELQQRLFQPFESTRGAGRGLGLCVVLGVVRSHHGLVHLDSEPGRGARFLVALPTEPEVVLPAAPRRFVPERAGAAAAGADLQGVTVLVVEENALVRSLLVRTLLREGCRVFEAADARSALRLFGSSPAAFDVVLVDLTVATGTASILLDELLALDPSACLVAMSGYGDGAAAGCAGAAEAFLGKPFLPEELLDALRDTLQRRRQASSGATTFP